METIEVRSKSYVIKWVHADHHSKIYYEVKPLKKSINLAIYTYKDGEVPANQDNNVLKALSNVGSEGRRRSSTVSSINSEHASLEAKLENSNLMKKADLGRLNGDELVKGEINAKTNNVYAFVFDNTFSKTTGKTILFSQYSDNHLSRQQDFKRNSAISENDVQPYQPTANGLPTIPSENNEDSANGSADASSDPIKPLEQRATNTSIRFNLPETGQSTNEFKVKGGKYLQGFLLKKRRKKTGKHFNKRYFTLNFKYGVLNYYSTNTSKHVRGNMFIKYVGITADPKTRIIVLDSGLELWTLKALTDEDLQVWVNAFNKIKRQGAKEPEGMHIDHTNPAMLEREADDFSVNDDALQDLITDLEMLQFKVEELRTRSGDLNKALASTPSPLNASLSRRSSISSLSGQSKRKSFWRRNRSDTISAIQEDGSSLDTSPESSTSNTESPTLIAKELDERIIETNNMVLQLISQQQFRSNSKNGSIPMKSPLSRGSTITTAANSIFSQEFYDANEYVNELNTGVLMINHNDSEVMASRDDLDSAARRSAPLDTDGTGQDDDATDDETSSSDDDDGAQPTLETPSSPATSVEADLYPLNAIEGPIKRRADILPSSGPPPSILSFVRKNIGKDLSTISMPVTSNEPLTALQKYSEMFEYSNILNNASQADLAAEERILMVAAFATSYLSSLRIKERNNRKPFNPLLGETFEMVREDLGVRVLAEKVSHRPQIFAIHADSENWALQYSPSPAQKFWSKNAEIISKGTIRLTFKNLNEVYQWSQPTCLLKNIIAGEKYTEPSSSIVVSSSTGQKAVVEFKQGGMFSGRSEQLNIRAFNKSQTPFSMEVYGTWTEKLLLKDNDNGTERVLWEAGKLVPEALRKYGFTQFAATLNEITPIEAGKVAPTDSRLRPDLQQYELGNIDKAETLKLKLELDQRNRRTAGENFVPLFFTQVSEDRYDIIKGERSYWERRKRSDWDGLLKLW